MEEIFPDKRNLIRPIEHASEGKLCLPEFQRDFVWARNEVADLMPVLSNLEADRVRRGSRQAQG